jgi:integrase
MRQSASFFNRSRIMTSSQPAVSPLRQRMIDDMRMRQLAPKTQANYLRIVREFARYLGRSPDTATVEDLRTYQLHLVDHGTSPISLNAAITGLKFFFEITLHEPELMARMQPVRVPRTLPVVLSPDEVRRLIAATGNLKHQTALSVAYGTGLRVSEVVGLKVTDVDSQRMTLRIEQGKGRKDRYAMLSPVLLERLLGLVARGPGPGQDARRRVAISRARSHRPAQHQATEPRHSCRRRGGPDRQARVHAHAAPLCAVPDYVG